MSVEIQARSEHQRKSVLGMNLLNAIPFSSDDVWIPSLKSFINSESYPVGMIFILELENVNPWVEIEGLRMYNVCITYQSCIKCNHKEDKETNSSPQASFYKK